MLNPYELFSSNFFWLNAYKVKEEIINGIAGLQACGTAGFANSTFHSAAGKFFGRLGGGGLGMVESLKKHRKAQRKVGKHMRKMDFLFLFLPMFPSRVHVFHTKFTLVIFLIDSSIQ